MFKKFKYLLKKKGDRVEGLPSTTFSLKSGAGFTMIELLVAISVFSIIIAVVSGIFITSLRSHRTSLALISANSDAQLVLEQMTRMIRKGEDFGADTIVGDGSGDMPQFKCLRFHYGSGGNNHIVYRWDRHKTFLERSVGNDYRECDADEGFYGMVSENLRVEFANFRVDYSDIYYPRITILLRVGTKNTQISSDKIPFTNLQVSVSPRGDSRY
ncbi:type II secretion system GspH family protein [Patescibacteria group bacterium]|nr:type II secretion system GspH family protein [Patescibacteria group bacterium]